MTNRLRLALVSAVGLSLAACSRDEQAGPAAAGGTATLQTWLTCIECTNGELDSAVALAKRDPAALRALGSALLGPPPAPASVDSQLRRSYAELDTEPDTGAWPDPVPDQAQYVAHYRENIAALRRVRAGVALSRVGGAEALRLLDSAANGLVRTRGDSIAPGALRALVVARDSAHIR